MDFIHIKRSGCLLVLIQMIVPMSLQQTSNACQECAVDANACRDVRGTYGVTVMSRGYNPVVTIPAGACNINITERASSNNFLALKTRGGVSILNGLWNINRPGQYRATGTVFMYQRSAIDEQCPGECLRSSGGNTEDLLVQLLYHHTNPGIDYSFQLPNQVERQGTVEEQPSVIEEHHRPHQHRHNTLSKPLDESERRHIEALKKGEDVPIDNKEEERRHESTSRREQHRRRRPLFSSDFSRRRPSLPHRRRRPHDSRYNRRNRLSDDITSDKRRQSLTDVTFSRPAPDAVEISLEKTSNAANSLGSVDGNPGNIDIQLNYVDQPGSGIYIWKMFGYTQCTQSCGEGVRETLIVCVEKKSQVRVADENCNMTSPLPKRHVTCNTRPCPPSWTKGGWSECSVSCGDGRQTREVVCTQRSNALETLSVPDDSCPDKKPLTERQCQKRPCTYWHTGNWTKCSVDCGEGDMRRVVTCRDGQNRSLDNDQCDGPKPPSEAPCDAGSCSWHWFFSNWQDKCSTDCSTGQMHRRVYCAADSGEQRPDEQCDADEKPRSEKQCQQQSEQRCGGRWFVGQWSECSVSCGEGERTRDVICVSKGNSQRNSTIETDDKCVDTDRPADREVCRQDNCGNQWYMTSWSVCSVTCGGGVKRRYVRCLNDDMTSSNTCSTDERPPDVMRCNTWDCWRAATPTASRCRDIIFNCRMVVQARLCRYSYYQRKCCKSCSNGYK